MRGTREEIRMVHLGLGGQYIAEGGMAYPTTKEDVEIQARKIVSILSF